MIWQGRDASLTGGFVKRIVLFLAALTFFTPSASFADNSVGTVVYTRGEAWILRGQQALEISESSPVYPGDTVSTTMAGRVKVAMADGSIMYVGGRSRIKIEDYMVRDGKLLHSNFNLIWGRASFHVDKLSAPGSKFAIRSQMVTLNTLGATFAIEGWKAGFRDNDSARSNATFWDSWMLIPSAMAMMPASTKEGGMAIVFPDVCKTPMEPPPPVPEAYPNIALTSGSAKIKVENNTKTSTATKPGGSVKTSTHAIRAGQMATFSSTGKISLRTVSPADRKYFNFAQLKLKRPALTQQQKAGPTSEKSAAIKAGGEGTNRTNKVSSQPGKKPASITNRPAPVVPQPGAKSTMIRPVIKKPAAPTGLPNTPASKRPTIKKTITRPEVKQPAPVKRPGIVTPPTPQPKPIIQQQIVAPKLKPAGP